MKTKYSILSLLLTILFSANGCQSPEELMPPVARNGINSVKAYFIGEDESTGFSGYTVEGSNEIVINIPYYYPESSTNRVTQEMLQKMHVKANLDDNVLIEPSILYMDMTKENKVVVTDQRKQKKEYTIRGVITKSSACEIEEFNLPEAGLSGVINQNDNTISLVTAETLQPMKADVRLSYHATISPDPATVDLDYNNEVTFVVTAHDGVTKKTYKVFKSIPNKIEMGIRVGSAKVMFAKKLLADLNAPVNNHGGMAVTKDYVVISTRENQSLVVDTKTGALKNPLDASFTGGGLGNMYNTADEKGNILVNNLAPNTGTFKIWKLSSVSATAEVFIDWSGSGSTAIGRRVSVKGDINSNAIITAPIHTTGSKFARWTVVNGVLTSHTPEIIEISGYSWSNYHSDVVYTSATDVNSDYFVVGYSNNRLARVSGTTNTVAASIDPNDANYISNAVDYVEFNKGKYVVYNHANSFTWGQADQIWLLNTEGNFAGVASNVAFWTSGKGKYGANAIGAAVNGNGTSDVAFRVSDDGYFLYLYFMFTNGYLVGVQFDCVDM